MSEPELEFEIDEFGCIRYRVTNEGVLLSKDEKEFIIDYVTRMQTENAKLRELVRDVWHLFTEHGAVNPCDLPVVDAVRDRMRELGVEVTS